MPMTAKQLARLEALEAIHPKGSDGKPAHDPALHSHNEQPPPTEPPATGYRFTGSWPEAIAAAPAHDDAIVVPAGTWPSPVIRPYAGLTIRGEPGAIIIRQGVPSTIDVGLIDVRVPDVTLDWLILRGTAQTNPGVGDDELIFGVGCHRLKVLRCKFEHASGVGIQTTNATDMLFEDVAITNVTLRNNGAHGVALWPYHGTLRSTYRRITIDGADFAGIFLDAGTSVGTAASVDDNVFEDVTIRNAARKDTSAWAIGASVMVTGAKRNRGTRFTITDQARGAAFAFGVDQSGLAATDNVFTAVQTARIASGQTMTVAPGCVGNVVSP